MASIKLHATKLSNRSQWTNPDNLLNDDKTNYGSLLTTYNQYKDFIIRGYDFSAIPPGSTIDKITMGIKCGTDSGVTLYYYCARRYQDGTYVTDQSTPSLYTVQTGGKLSEYAITGTDRFGRWTRDELCGGANSGIGLYFRVRATSSNKYLHIYVCFLTVTYTPPTYSVSKSLTHVTASNGAASVTGGDSYSCTLTPDSGYELDSVTVTMGGTNVTSSVYANGAINIANVTGNIAITASASVPRLPEISTVSVAPNPADTGQGLVLTVVFA